MKNKFMAGALVASFILLAGCGSTASKNTVKLPERTATSEDEVDGDSEIEDFDEAELTETTDDEPDTTDQEAESETDSDTDSKDVGIIMELEPDVSMEIGGKTVTASIPNREDEYSEGEIVVSVDDESLVLDYAEGLGTSYIFYNSEGELFLLIQGEFLNDWKCIYALSYDENGLKKQGVYYGGIDGQESIQGDEVTLVSREDLFGTYGISVNYRIQGYSLSQIGTYVEFINEMADPSGHFLDDCEEGDYLTMVFDEYGMRILKVIHSFSATTESGTIDIPEGSIIYPVGYDDSIKAFYFTYEGEKMYATYTEDEEEYQLYLDGINQYELFEMLPYAG